MRGILCDKSDLINLIANVCDNCLSTIMLLSIVLVLFRVFILGCFTDKNVCYVNFQLLLGLAVLFVLVVIQVDG